MLDITAIAGKVAGIISLIGFIFYIVSILRGETKPERATWFIWTIVSSMLLVSYHYSGAEDTIWVPVINAVMTTIIFGLSFKYGTGGWTPFDRGCLVSVLISLILWWIFSSPLVALVINIVIDLMGALPTIKKSYSEPESEDRIAWAVTLLGNAINMFAIESWTFSITIYPIYMLLANGLITTLIFVRRKP